MSWEPPLFARLYRKSQGTQGLPQVDGFTRSPGNGVPKPKRSALIFWPSSFFFGWAPEGVGFPFGSSLENPSKGGYRLPSTHSETHRGVFSGLRWLSWASSGPLWPQGAR